MKSYIDVVNEIKNLSKSRITNIRKGMLAGHMCRPLSPYLSAMFIKKGILPPCLVEGRFMIWERIYG